MPRRGPAPCSALVPQQLSKRHSRRNRRWRAPPLPHALTSAYHPQFQVGREEDADALIEQMARDADPILRYGGAYATGLAYRRARKRDDRMAQES